MLTFFASVLLKLLSDREQNKWKTCEKSLYQKLFSNRDFPLIWRCGKTVLLSNPQYVRKAHYAVKRMSKSRINLLIFCFIKSINKCWRKKYWFLSYHSILLLPISQRCWNFLLWIIKSSDTDTRNVQSVQSHRHRPRQCPKFLPIFLSDWFDTSILWLCRSIRKHT